MVVVAVVSVVVVAESPAGADVCLLTDVCYRRRRGYSNQHVSTAHLLPRNCFETVSYVKTGEMAPALA